MENSTAGKRKLRKRAQKRPLGDNEENGSCTKKRTGIDPKSSSTSPEVDMKRRKTKRKASTRNNKKVCREENNVEITRENTQGLQNMPDDKEKFTIKYDTEIDKNIDGNILSDKNADTKEEVENQLTSVTNIQKSSSVPKGEESASPSNTQQTKYVPRFGKKRKRGIEEIQAAEPKEEDHSDTTTNVDTVPTLPTDDNNLVQKHEDVAMISTVVDEEKKTVSDSEFEDGVVKESTEVDTVETMSTESTACNVTGLSTNLKQEQKDKAKTSNIIAEEKDSVSESMIVSSTANTCDTSNQHASGDTIVPSTVQTNDSEPEIMVTDTAPKQDEIKTAKEDEACSPNNNTCGDSIMSSTGQANRSEPETTAVIKPQKEDNIAMKEEACCFPDNLSSQNSKPQTVQGSGDGVSAPLTEPGKEKVAKEMGSSPVEEVARDVLSTIIEKIVTQDAATCTQVTVSTASQGKEQQSEGGPEGDNNERKVQRADDSDTSDAQVTTQETVSAESQGKEQVRPTGGTGSDTVKMTDGQKDDDPGASASDAQEATQDTVFEESHREEEGSNGGGNDSGKKVEQKDGDSPAPTASDAQQTREMDEDGTRKTDEEGTGQNSLQQSTANEQKDSHLTNNSSGDKTTEDQNQEDSQGLDNFMDSLSSSQLYQMEQEALTTAQHINALPARQAPDEGARKAILGLTTDLASLNRSVMSVWREFNTVQKKRLARKKEQVAKASRPPPNTFRTDGITSQSVTIPRQGSSTHRQVAQQNPTPTKMGKDKKGSSSRGPPNVRPHHLQSGQQQNPSVMKIRKDKKVVFNKLDQQKKIDQHKIRPTSLQSMKNRQQGRLLPMPKPGTSSKNLTTGKLPFQGTTSQRQPGGVSGPYQPNSSSRGYQHILPNGKPQNGSAPTKGSSSNSFNFTPTKLAQAGRSLKMVGQQAAPPSRIEGSHNLMSCPSVNYRTYAK